LATVKTKRTVGIGDEAVKAKTGRTWEEWCKTLDRAGCMKMDHKSIAKYVYENFPGVGGWWSQMVAVGYEQARGLRRAHETATGFAVSVSRTIGAPVAKVYGTWKDKKQRAAWLAKPDFTVRKATANKSMRITWVDGRSSLEVNFYSKGAGKSQIVVQHTKLASEPAVRRMRTFWSRELDKLKASLGR